MRLWARALDMRAWTPDDVRRDRITFGDPRPLCLRSFRSSVAFLRRFAESVNHPSIAGATVDSSSDYLLALAGLAGAAWLLAALWRALIQRMALEPEQLAQDIRSYARLAAVAAIATAVYAPLARWPRWTLAVAALVWAALSIGPRLVLFVLPRALGRGSSADRLGLGFVTITGMLATVFAACFVVLWLIYLAVDWISRS